MINIKLRSKMTGKKMEFQAWFKSNDKRWNFYDKRWNEIKIQNEENRGISKIRVSTTNKIEWAVMYVVNKVTKTSAVYFGHKGPLGTGAIGPFYPNVPYNWRKLVHFGQCTYTLTSLYFTSDYTVHITVEILFNVFATWAPETGRHFGCVLRPNWCPKLFVKIHFQNLR